MAQRASETGTSAAQYPVWHYQYQHLSLHCVVRNLTRFAAFHRGARQMDQRWQPCSTRTSDQLYVAETWTLTVVWT
uniref:Uncharacterized protein n=1 Tax=Spironucleus salmonicida TaxID=348837 RepID=V6M4E9_9EUKA|eukprot:EST48189.1 Hypothetical protein SS50377_fx014 [Spironucleus salmonicida]